MQYTQKFQFTIINCRIQMNNNKTLQSQLMHFPTRIFWVNCFCLLLSKPLLSQNLGLELCTGTQFTNLNHSQISNYKTQSNHNYRIGIVFGNFDKITGSIIVGSNSFKSLYVSDIAISEIELSYTSIDIPLRIIFSKGIKSISIGPSFLTKNFSSQTTNNQQIRNDRMFRSNIFALNAEIAFKGWEIPSGEINPFIYYRQTFNGIEETTQNELTNFQQFGVGAKVYFLWEI
jgi:hypothetical protein